MIELFSWFDGGVVVWGNSVISYAESVLLFAIFSLIFFAVQWTVVSRAKVLADRTKTEVDNVAIRVVESFRPPLFVFLSAYFAIRTLTLNELARESVNVILIILITYQVVVTLQVIVDALTQKMFQGKSDAHSRSVAQLLGSIAKGVVWVFGILVVLSNLGVNVTSLLAGVGIGGIAIAFALQNILKDLFSSFSIYLEKPFSVGDYIVVGESSGTVKKIGIKTTRLKSFRGEEIVIPNSELASARIENYKKMERRHVTKQFRVSYETPSEVLEKIPVWIEEIAKQIDGVLFTRCSFRDMTDDALVFEYTYRIDTGKYETYVNIRQAFNFAIKKKFEQEGVKFAYPTMKIVK